MMRHFFRNRIAPVGLALGLLSAPASGAAPSTDSNAATAATTSLLTLYGGEDVALGGPFHHEALSLWATVGNSSYEGGMLAHPVYGSEGVGMYVGTGFSREAGAAIAWHADYIDSYLYSPLWWAQGGVPNVGVRDRYSIARALHNDLVKIHFDDLFNPRDVERAWKQYLTGALIGLDWAYQHDDVDAAHNILGLLLHATQDFYTHSSWITASPRENATFVQIAYQLPSDLFTGAYETANASPVHHGTYSLTCSALGAGKGVSGAATKTLIKSACSSYPFNGAAFCATAAKCDEGGASGLTVVTSNKLGSSVLLAPKGMALDTTWGAEVGADIRELTTANGRTFRGDHGKRGWLQDAQNPDSLSSYDPQECSRSLDILAEGGTAKAPKFRPCREDVASDRVFASSKHLATMASMEMLAFIETEMTRMGEGHRRFFERVKTEGSACRPLSGEGIAGKTPADCDRTAQFEDLSKLPFTFMSAGPYPFANPSSEEMLLTSGVRQTTSEDGWYLRLTLDTANEAEAGTDADVWTDVRIDGQTHRTLLDYVPLSRRSAGAIDAIAVYDDFEAGSSATYVLGPFSQMPDAIDLKLDISTPTDILSALGNDFLVFSTEVADAVGDLLSFAVGAKPDFIGRNRGRWTKADIDTMIDQTTESTAVLRQYGAYDGSVAGKARENIASTTIRLGKPSADGFRGIFDTTEGYYELRIVFGRRQGTNGETVYRVWIHSVKCLEESTVDGVSGKDEPFFFVSSLLQGSPVDYDFTGPLNGMNTGTTNVINKGLADGPLGDGQSFSLLALGYESDAEFAETREEMFAGFQGEVEASLLSQLSSIDAIASREANAPWKLARASIYAFRRGEAPAGGYVFGRDVNQWLDTDRSTLRLDLGAPPTSVAGTRLNISRTVVRDRLDALAFEPLRHRPHRNDTIAGYFRVDPTARNSSGADVARIHTQSTTTLTYGWVGENLALFRRTGNGRLGAGFIDNGSDKPARALIGRNTDGIILTLLDRPVKTLSFLREMPGPARSLETPVPGVMRDRHAARVMAGTWTTPIGEISFETRGDDLVGRIGDDLLIATEAKALGNGSTTYEFTLLGPDKRESWVGIRSMTRLAFIRSDGTPRGFDAVRTTPEPMGVSWEANVNRRGGDYKNFLLANNNPAECRAACNDDAKCQAFTFVPAGVRPGQNQGRCWLKNSVPLASNESGIISGVRSSVRHTAVAVNQARFAYEKDGRTLIGEVVKMDRPDPALCRAACERSSACRTFTYLPPSTSDETGTCRLVPTRPASIYLRGAVSGAKDQVF